jgi:hypothetical protein
MKTHLINSLFSLILFSSLSHARELDPETLKTLNDDSFKVRDEATKKLITSVWIGKGTWKKWTPDSKDLIPMGTTNEGKTIFAVRAEWENGSHPGTLIQGETKARIPWGGKVILLDDFEALHPE